MQRHYNTVNFHPNPHKRHPIVRPWGRGMGCLLCVQPLSKFCPSRCSVVYNIMFYETTLQQHSTAYPTEARLGCHCPCKCRARPSADTMLTTKSSMFSSKHPWTPFADHAYVIKMMLQLSLLDYSTLLSHRDSTRMEVTRKSINPGHIPNIKHYH